MLELYTTSCCGLGEIVDIRGVPVSDFIHDFRAERRYDDDAPLVYIFTDAKAKGQKGPTHGDKIADMIEKNGYGVVLRSRYKHNPNSGNSVRVFTWTFSSKARREL